MGIKAQMSRSYGGLLAVVTDGDSTCWSVSEIYIKHIIYFCCEFDLECVADCDGTERTSGL